MIVLVWLGTSNNVLLVLVIIDLIVFSQFSGNAFASIPLLNMKFINNYFFYSICREKLIEPVSEFIQMTPTSPADLKGHVAGKLRTCKVKPSNGSRSPRMIVRVREVHVLGRVIVADTFCALLRHLLEMIESL